MEENKTEEVLSFADSDEEASEQASLEELPSSSVEGEENKQREREEYDELIKTRFRGYYAEDVQKTVNRRFRKYKVMEERYKVMEDLLEEKDQIISRKEQEISAISEKIKLEAEAAAKAAEERVLSELRKRKMRPDELGLTARTIPQHTDVSRLTRSERAKLAERAYRGERIKF